MHLDKPEWVQKKTWIYWAFNLEHKTSPKRSPCLSYSFPWGWYIGERAPQGKGLFAWPPTGWYLGVSSIPLVEIYGINVLFSRKGQRRFFEEKKEVCMLCLFTFSVSFFIKCFFLSGLNLGQILVQIAKNNFVDRHVKKNVVFDGTKPSNPMPAPVEQRLKPLADISDWWKWRDPYNDGLLKSPM